jgi:SM-20-related protein
MNHRIDTIDEDDEGSMNTHHYDNNHDNNQARSNNTLLRGAMLFHRIGEFAILAVIAIAITTIPFQFLSISKVHAFAPTTTTIINPQFHTKMIASSPLISLKAADTSRPPTSSRNPGISSDSDSDNDNEISRIDASDLATLRDQGYVIIDDFLTSETWMEALRDDVMNLRQKNKFKIAKIGQDSTNTLNEEIRVAETCFLGRDKPELKDVHNQAREKLYEVLETLRMDLQEGGGNKLDPNLSEFLYAYYPTGGFYRRHRDAVKGSASWLREYSLLLYLNEESYDPDTDGGRLRVHFDSGGDFLPDGEAPLFQDVDAFGGTLVIFESNKFPHEVLDTVAERFAVVGWYNRPMTLGDLKDVSNDRGSGGGIASDDPMRLVALAAAAGLVTVGLINILAS